MLIVANWKAYVEQVEKAKALVAAATRLAAKSDVVIVLAPPAPYLGMFAKKEAKKAIKKVAKKEKGGRKGVAFAAQDISNTTGGAATGETTPALLAEMGVSYTLVGHSERRAMGETDAMVSSKVQHALAHGITPVVCIGERDRDADAHYLQFLRMQIVAVYEPLQQKDRERIILAYEPIWAIGKTAAESIQPHDLQEMVLYIRKVLADYLGDGAGKAVILYGGSVEPGNIRSLADDSGVNGFLIGHATVDVSTFTSLIKAVA